MQAYSLQVYQKRDCHRCFPINFAKLGEPKAAQLNNAGWVFFQENMKRPANN